MDFKLTEDQLMVRQTVREFAQKEVKPLSRQLDARIDPGECISWELVKKASDLGIRVLGIPRESGGLGADIITRLIIQEELAAADIGFADLMRDHGWSFELMNQQQREEFLPQYLEDYRYFVAGANTEPDHGSDHLMDYDEPEASIQTFAERRGDAYIINGTKQFISNAPVAKLFMVQTRTDRKLPIRQCGSMFLVPLGTPGLKIGKAMNKLGLRLHLNGEVILEDVHVPIRYKIGEEDKGGKMAKGAKREVDSIASVIFANTIGLCRCAYQESLAYARMRIQGDKPIIQHTNIAMRLAEMKVKIEAARAIVWRNAWCVENNYEYDPQLWKLIRAFVSKIAVDVVSSAVEIHGGSGIDRDLPIEKYLRDVFSSLHTPGTIDVSLIRGAPTMTAD